MSAYRLDTPAPHALTTTPDTLAGTPGIRGTCTCGTTVWLTTQDRLDTWWNNHAPKRARGN